MRGERELDEIELKEWLQRRASGDQQAFQVIYEFTCKDIYRTVAFLVVDKQDVEDIVNEVYIQIWKYVVNYDVKGELSSRSGSFY
ncbi:RNA polymerase subunit sigma-70 [Bacillus pseudomycoides]|nr:RNA polymerase subunit sigma-70 [Bacillus pseudomycoides]